jgi:hypothetical protein
MVMGLLVIRLKRVDLIAKSFRSGDGQQSVESSLSLVDLRELAQVVVV